MSGPNVALVASWLAGLSYPSGVQVVDLDRIPTSVIESALPLLCPEPVDFVSGLRTEFVTFSPGHRTYEVRYQLHYNLFFAAIGSSGSILFAMYPGLVAAAMSVAGAFLDNEAPPVTPYICEWVKLADMPRFEPVSDPSGKVFHGATFALDVMEVATQGG